MTHGGRRVRVRDHHYRGPAVGILCDAEAETGGAAPVDEPLAQNAIATVDHLDSDRVDQLLATERRVHRGECRGSQLEASGITSQAKALDVEIELILDREPARDPRSPLANSIRPDVEVRQPRPSAEPFEGTRRVNVDIRLVESQGHLSGTLVPVDDERSVDVVSDLCEPLEVLHRTGGEEHMAGCDQECALVHGLTELVEVDASAVFATQQHHLQLRLGTPLIDQGGEVELGGDHSRTAGVLREALGDDRKRGRGRWKKRKGLGCRAVKAGHQRPERLHTSEPMLIPCRRSQFVPTGSEVVQVLFAAETQRSQGARVQIGSSI